MHLEVTKYEKKNISLSMFFAHFCFNVYSSIPQCRHMKMEQSTNLFYTLNGQLNEY